MDQVKQVALTKALAFLRASGADFAVQMPDDSVATSEGWKTMTLTAKPVKQKRQLINNFVEGTGYLSTLKQLEVGGSITFRRADYPTLFGPGNPLAKRAWLSFYASIKSYCRRRWTEDGYALAEHDDVIEVLRVS